MVHLLVKGRSSEGEHLMHKGGSLPGDTVARDVADEGLLSI